MQNQNEIKCHLNVIKDLSDKISRLEKINNNINPKGSNRKTCKSKEDIPSKFTSTNSPVNVTSLEVIADSHGRGLSELLSLKACYPTTGLVKPGARSSEIFNTKLFDSKIYIILAGANDVYHNETTKFLSGLKNFLASHTKVKTILCTMPYRYDLPSWSHINKEIKDANSKILELCHPFGNVKVVDIGGLGRRFHTYHGLHLNVFGKSHLCERILYQVNNFGIPIEQNKRNTTVLSDINSGN
jgi:hypothetical protein